MRKVRRALRTVCLLVLAAAAVVSPRSSSIEGTVAVAPVDFQDSDKDGLSDLLEATHNPQFFGSNSKDWPNPLRADIYLEIDWTNEIPEPVKDTVIAFFAGAPVRNPDGSTGISLHIDDGTPNYDMGGGDRIMAPVVCVSSEYSCINSDDRSLVSWKHLYESRFDPSRRGIFHYAVVAERLRPDVLGAANFSPSAESGGDDKFAISYGKSALDFPLLRTKGELPQDWKAEDSLAAALVHELLHNIVGMLDDRNAAHFYDRGHTRWPEDILHGHNPKSSFALRESVWEEIERDGVGISFDAIRV